MQNLNNQEKTLNLPAFFPDATYSTISHVPLYIVESILTGVVITTLHATANNLDTLLEELNISFSQFANLPQNIITLSDSGGFQVLSLIHNKKLGKITPDYAKFKYPKDGKIIKLTPEESQNIQHKLKTDIRTALDYPIMGHENIKTIQKSIKITIDWAKRSKKQFLKLLNIKNSEFKKTSPNIQKINNFSYQLKFSRPLLNGVIQGGNDKKARQECAQELTKIGFDLYGFGGWPITPEGNLNTDILEHFLTIIPSDKIAYAMGLGTPDDMATLIYMGYHLFDCTIPTRNARHGTLFVSKNNGEPKGKHYDVLHIKTERYIYDNKPIDPNCNCPVCKKYSRSYIRFLFKSKNPVASTLASIHNIWWYNNFIQKIKENSMALNFNIQDTKAKNNSNNSKQQLLLKAKATKQPSQNTLYIYHDATCKVQNAHIKGHSGKGKATCGFFFQINNKTILTKTIPVADNITIPEAEFRCFLFALEHAYNLIKKQNKKLFITKIITFTDSQLLAFWINGKYKIKKPHIKKLYEQYQQISNKFAKLNILVQVNWHARENKKASIADRLANE